MDRTEKRRQYLERAALRKLQTRSESGDVLDAEEAGRLKIQTWMPGRRILTGLAGVAPAVIAWFFTGWLSATLLALGILLILAGFLGVRRTLESVFDGGVEALASVVFD